ncbi:hypothetical protein ACTWPT_59640 [Nonomuraea sp. 3N208]
MDGVEVDMDNCVGVPAGLDAAAPDGADRAGGSGGVREAHAVIQPAMP